MIITAKGAKNISDKYVENKKNEFLRKFHTEGYAEEFNSAVEESASKGKDRTIVSYPEGYLMEATNYFENELGFMTVLCSTPGKIYVAW